MPGGSRHLQAVAVLVVSVVSTAPAQANPSKPLVLQLVGDTGHPVELGASKVRKPFAAVQSILDGGDANFANLECPFTLRKPTAPTLEPMHCEPKTLRPILQAGFNLLSLANNHALDASGAGVRDTLAALAKAKKLRKRLWWAGAALTPAAAKKPAWLTLKGTRIALFAVAATNPKGGIASIRDFTLHKRIKRAAVKADLVIVSAHFGTEYVHVPTTDTTKRFRALIDAGADLVVGHHPHVIQGVERYKKGVIFYSLGNFSFGTTSKKYQQQGARMYSMLVRVEVKQKKLDQIELIPLYANNTDPWLLAGKIVRAKHATPQPLWGPHAGYVINELSRFTKAIPSASPTKLITVGDRTFVDIGKPLDERRLLARQAIDRKHAEQAGAGPQAPTRAERALPAKPRAKLLSTQKP